MLCRSRWNLPPQSFGVRCGNVRQALGIISQKLRGKSDFGGSGEAAGFPGSNGKHIPFGLSYVSGLAVYRMERCPVSWQQRHYSSTVEDSDPKGSGVGDISDQEWNMRFGRAVDTLEGTLPSFFETGLSSIRVTEHEHTKTESSRRVHGTETIYAPNIRLVYTPPSASALPAAFPKTIQVEGLPLYHASAAFIRHTLSALHTHLQVDLCKLTVRKLGGPRERQIAIRTIVSGQSRLSGTRNEWDVVSIYTPSPHTGLIELHVVQSIQPAPHVSFFDGLHTALTRLAGIEVGRPATTHSNNASTTSR